MHGWSTSAAGAHLPVSNERIVPNAALRLFERELRGHRAATAVHTARRFAECILPSQKVLEVEAPDAHIGRFTLDGNHLVCFSLQLNTVVLFDYLGPSPQPARSPDEPVGFSRFFRERWRLPLCSGSEQLSRDFAVCLRGGAFLLLASSVAARGPPPAADAAAAGEAPAVAPTDAAGANAGAAAAGPVNADDPAVPWDAAAPAGQPGEGQARRLPSGDLFESIAFHVVDVQRGMKVDERRFSQDFFDLSGNACASLYDSTLALTSICKQTVHLLHVSSDGSLTDIQSIGRFCQADDLLPIQMAAAAEQQWQLQQQQQRQQHDKQRLQAGGEKQQQQQLHQEQQQLPHGTGRPHGSPAADVAASSAAQQQQQQQQHQPMQQQQQQHNSAGVGAAAAAAEAGGHDRPGSGVGAGVRRRRPAAAADSDDDDDDEMERRERRRRRPAPRNDADDHHQQPHHSQQQQQQHQQTLASSQDELAARGGAAAAAAAAALAVLDPSCCLIQGLQQRLLTFLHRCILEGCPCDVAPSLRDLQHNFGVLSSLVVWRARLLDRQHLLLKLGAPAPGPAAAAELSASRVHFFAVYDLVATRFKGFWRGSSGQLLANIMAQPSQLLAAGQDPSPWERCCAAALYPPGLPVGLGQHEQQQQQQGQPGPSTEATRQQRRGNTGGSSGGGRGTAGPPQQHHQQQHQQLQQEPQQQRQLVSAHAPPAAAAAAAAARTGASHGSSRSGAGVAASATASAATDDSSGSKAAKERLKLLRQVVLLVLPGLQSLSPSPYLDPHLFSYSKHISPIMGLRNSPAEPLIFRLARQYSCGREQRQAGPPAARDGQRQRPPGASEAPQQAVLQLQPAVPQSVTWGSEEVARRQLHLFHPADPFVLTVVQTIAQPAVVSILYR